MVKPKLTSRGWRASIYIGKDIYNRKKYKDIYAKSEEECNKKVIDYLYLKNNNLLDTKIQNCEDNSFNTLYENYVNNRAVQL